MESNQTTTPLPFWPVIFRGMMCRCPKCGEGKLFRAYLKPVEHCNACGEAFGHIRADDGPAWLTIVIITHILAPVMLAVLPGSTLPEWALLLILCVPAIVLMLVLLPICKGAFISAIWRLNAQKE